MNSTDTPGGSGIPAGWYDDPSGEGLRWWDGEQWTEHVHSAESAAAATAAVDSDEVPDEGRPPRDLVKLRESIRGRGVKAVGMVLGAIVLLIVVVVLLVSGGSDNSNGPVRTFSPAGKVDGVVVARRAQIRRIDRRLRSEKLSQAQRKKLRAQRRKLERGAGEAAEK